MKAFISLLILNYPTPPHLFTCSLIHPFPLIPTLSLSLLVSISCCPSPTSPFLRLSISCVCCVCLCSSVLFVSFNILSNSSGWIVYLPIHSNALNSISLKRLSGSTCLTGFNLFRVFGVFGVFEVFKGIRLVQRFHSYNNSYNPLSKNP